MTEASAQTDSREQPAGDLAHLVSGRRTAARLAAAMLSAVLLSVAFPPCELWVAAWFGLVPLLLVPMPATRWRRAVLGYVFGYLYWMLSLQWLNEVGFGAGYLLALVCGLFPMVWYVLTCEAWLTLAAREEELPRTERRMAALPGPGRQCAFMAVAACLWVCLEWVRGWIFTGFPWNQLGVSQWQRLGLIQMCAWTGVYGISFLLVAVNVALGFAAVSWVRRLRGAGGSSFSRPLAVAAVLFVPVFVAARVGRERGEPSAVIRFLGVQGNIPMCREWTPEQFQDALATYVQLTEQHVPVVGPDVVVWPESAVPAPIGYKPFKFAFEHMLAQLDCHVLIGALDTRALPGAKWLGNGWDPPSQDFNCALLYGPDGQLIDYYDKIHRVPFGEYTPFAQYLPWLVDWIGMGRGLTAGTEYTVFRLPKGARAGVNICFEDAFAGISRKFAQRGANLLMTLTNDAWYAESAGSRQHLTHAVFRAVECGLPLFRSGNNSDTCLIMPDGEVTGLLRDPLTGYPFVRGAKGYDVPVWNRAAQTFYVRYGDVFAWGCAFASLCVFAVVFSLRIRGKRRQLQSLQQEAGG